MLSFQVMQVLDLMPVALQMQLFLDVGMQIVLVNVVAMRMQIFAVHVMMITLMIVSKIVLVFGAVAL